ncbi:MAG: LptF/LptG family permease [Pseudomonadota bacterium]
MRARTLILFLNGTVARSILLAWAVLAMLGLAIELRERAEPLLALGGTTAILRFAIIALPDVLVTVFPIALLAGAVLGFGMLARRGEAVILRAAGLSVIQIGWMLLPLGLILGGLLYLLNDRIVPFAEAARAAQFGALGKDDPAARQIWLRADGWIIRAEPTRPDGTELAAVTLFQLGANGALTRRIDAPHAAFLDRAWHLDSATETSAETGETQRIDDALWPSDLAPEDIRALAGSDRALTRAGAMEALAGERLMTEGRSFYEMRATRGLSLAAMPAVLILLALPVVLGSGRDSGALLKATAMSAGLGLLFVMGEGLAASLGERGMIEPIYAAWVPVATAGCLGLWAILRVEA